MKVHETRVMLLNILAIFLILHYIILFYMQYMAGSLMPVATA